MGDDAAGGASHARIVLPLGSGGLGASRRGLDRRRDAKSLRALQTEGARVVDLEHHMATPALGLTDRTLEAADLELQEAAGVVH